MKQLTGILLIAVSAASFGTLAIFGRFAYRDGMDIFTVLFLRFGLSASFMTLVLLLRKEPFPRGRILAQLVGMGALGYVGQSFLYMTASTMPRRAWWLCYYIFTRSSSPCFRSSYSCAKN